MPRGEGNRGSERLRMKIQLSEARAMVNESEEVEAVMSKYDVGGKERTRPWKTRLTILGGGRRGVNLSKGDRRTVMGKKGVLHSIR